MPLSLSSDSEPEEISNAASKQEQANKAKTNQLLKQELKAKRRLYHEKMAAHKESIGKRVKRDLVNEDQDPLEMKPIPMAKPVKRIK